MKESRVSKRWDMSDLGLIASPFGISVVFAITPFVIPAVMDEFGATLVQAGLYSTVMGAAFMIVSFGAGYIFRASRRLLLVCNLTLALACVASGVVSSYTWLLVMSFVIGLTSGLINWLAWAQAASRPVMVPRVAGASEAGFLSILVLGPIILAWGRLGGFVFSATLILVVSLLPVSIAPIQRVTRAATRSAPNWTLMLSLGVFSIFGAGLWVYVGVRLAELNAGPWVMTLAIASHSFLGILALRITPKRLWPWFAGIVVGIALVSIPPVVWLIVVGLLIWGAAFLPATAGAVRLIDKRSAFPGEYTSLTQGLRSVGRVAGPLVGGGLESLGGFALLGVVATVSMTATTVAIGIDERRGTEPVGRGSIRSGNVKDDNLQRKPPLFAEFEDCD